MPLATAHCLQILFLSRTPGHVPLPVPQKNTVYPFIGARSSPHPPMACLSLSTSLSPSLIFNLDSSSKPSFFSRVVNKVVPCVTDSPLPNQPKDILHPESHVSETRPAVLQSTPTTDPPLVPPPLVLAHVPIFSLNDSDDATPNAFQSQDIESPISTATIPDKQIAMLDDLELMRNGGNGIPMGPVSISLAFPCHSHHNTFHLQDGLPKPLLPPVAPEHVGRKCLILDLDETLVHSSFKVLALPLPYLALTCLFFLYLSFVCVACTTSRLCCACRTRIQLASFPCPQTTRCRRILEENGGAL